MHGGFSIQGGQPPLSTLFFVELCRWALREVPRQTNMVRVGVAMLQKHWHEHSEALYAASRQLGIQIEIVELRMGKQVDSNLIAWFYQGANQLQCEGQAKVNLSFPLFFYG